ncbi:unnamed protein product [Ambrosiozyma monospora]|uniref:Unnamed protein product n=1 Tax=Ambrosiozyma monospora TaxID=43982 RepID=A0A9W6YSF1_AMBMO|nr:unnamed protein product [Ambrosiozyma monospora]
MGFEEVKSYSIGSPPTAHGFKVVSDDVNDWKQILELALPKRISSSWSVSSLLLLLLSLLWLTLDKLLLTFVFVLKDGSVMPLIMSIAVRKIVGILPKDKLGNMS